jgi:hypothetical protein
VVCNVSLVSQWYDEAMSKLKAMDSSGSKRSGGGKNKKKKEASMSVYRYYGSGRCRDPKILSKHDIVVTTFAVLAADWKGNRKKKSKGVSPITGKVMLDDSELEADPEWAPGPLQQVTKRRGSNEKRKGCV